ncbi:hypothetical protein ES706_03947 [subsurface metagenome]
MTLVNTRETDWYLLLSEVGAEAISSGIEVDILNSAIKQSILKHWLPIVFTGYETPLSLESVDNKRGFDSSDQNVNGWLSLIREQLYSNPSVEDIFVSIEDSDVDVWVVIPERDITVLDQLADIEWELLEMFVSGKHPAFLIDFHIIYRCGRNVEDLAPTRAIRIPR